MLTYQSGILAFVLKLGRFANAKLLSMSHADTAEGFIFYKLMQCRYKSSYIFDLTGILKNPYITENSHEIFRLCQYTIQNSYSLRMSFTPSGDTRP